MSQSLAEFFNIDTTTPQFFRGLLNWVRYNPDRQMPFGFQPAANVSDRKTRRIDRRAILGATLAAGLLGIQPASAAFMLKGGNDPTIPPPPPGPPFEPPAIPAAVLQLSWTGAGSIGTGVVEGASNSWTISTSVPAFLSMNGQQYATLNDVYVAAAPKGDFTMKLPLGKGYYQCGNTAIACIAATYAGRSFALVYDGAFNGFGPAPTGYPDMWDCVIKSDRVSSQVFLWVDDASHTSTITLRNIALSPWKSDIDANFNVQIGAASGRGLVFKQRCGIICIDRCQLGRSRANGFSSATDYEWESLRNDIVLIFDSELYGNGVNPDQHNIYCHDCLLARFIRIFSHDSGAHAWKVDSGADQAINSTFCGNMLNITVGTSVLGARAPCIDISAATDSYMRKCFVKSTVNSAARKMYQVLVRRENSSFNSLKYPPLFRTNTGYAEARKIYWFYGHTAGSQDSGAVLASPYAAGTTQVTLQNVRQKIFSTGARIYSDTTPHAVDLQIYCNDGSVLATTGTIVSSTGSATVVNLDTPLPFAAGTASLKYPVLIKYNASSIGGAQNWDFPTFTADGRQRPLNDPTDPNYYWDVVAPGGVLQFDKQNTATWGFPVQYVEDTMFAIMPPNSQTVTWAISLFRDWLTTYFSSIAQIQSPPSGNFPSTDASWVTPPGAGSFPAQLQANVGTEPHRIMGNNATGGTGIFGSNWVKNFMEAFKNIGFFDLDVAVANRFTSQVVTDEDDGSGAPYSVNVDVNAKYLDSAGVLQTITPNARTNPFPSQSKAYIATALGIGATSGMLTGLVGTAPVLNQRVLIQLAHGKGVHASTVVSYSGGVLTWVDPLEFDGIVSAAVTVFNAAGSNPTGWRTPEQFQAPTPPI